jgi:hypothetical protein
MLDLLGFVSRHTEARGQGGKSGSRFVAEVGTHAGAWAGSGGQALVAPTSPNLCRVAVHHDANTGREARIGPCPI